MTQGAPRINDVLDALREKRTIESAMTPPDADEQRRLEELDKYLEVMATVGSERSDKVTGLGSDRAQVTYETADDLWRAVRRNINKDGLFISTKAYPPIDTVFQLEVQVGDPVLQFSCEVKVIWVNPQPRTGRSVGMGVKFLWQEPDSRKRFRGFVSGEVSPQELAQLR